jgi:hypothetical protein
MSVCAPEAMTGQPSCCAGVGASKARSNQVRVRGVKTESGFTLTSAYRGAAIRTSVLSDIVRSVPETPEQLWERVLDDILPPLPEDVWRENMATVARELA